MKKLITLMLLALAGMVNANATDDLYLRSNLNATFENNWLTWDNNLDDYKFTFKETNSSNEDVYWYLLDASSFSGDINFRVILSSWGTTQISPYKDGNYTLSLLADGKTSETYGARYHTTDFQSSSVYFTISHSTIKASHYKIWVLRGNNYVEYKNVNERYMWIYFEIVDMPVTITDSYATFSCDRALDFTGTGITAYIAESTASGNVTMTPVTKVPANTGLFLAGTTANIPVIASSDAEAVETNYLHPTDGTTDIYNTTNPCYVLANQDGVGFFKVTSSCTPAKGKAYLQLESPVTSSRLNILFDEATGIKNIAARQTSGEAYNLHGQRIAQPAKGLYIVNGKKVIKK